MKLRKFGQAVLASVVGLGLSFGLTSCDQSHSIGYFFVTGSTGGGVSSGLISSYKIDNNTGNLTLAGASPYGTNGLNPEDAIVTGGGKFLYVLNAGCADPTTFPDAKFPCASGQAATGSAISLFTIGGSGALSFQLTYTSQGQNSVAITTDSTGSFLYVLDQNAPNGSNIPAQYAQTGDVSAFTIDQNTGRLTPIENQQVKDNNGLPLTFFPVGMDPTWFTVFDSYIFDIDGNTTATTTPTYVHVYSQATSGQLTLTPNSVIPTGATDLTYVYGKGSYLYLLDAGNPGGNLSNPPCASTTPDSCLNGAIDIYTVGTSGALASVTGGAEPQAAQGYTTSVNPSTMIVENGGKYVYIANYGLNTSLSEAASNISSYYINTSNGTLSTVGGVTAINGTNGGTINSGVGSGPRCILEDPSNQYLFTANYNDSTISGFIINTEAGALTPQRKKSTFTAPGNPTWCVASGTTF